MRVVPLASDMVRWQGSEIGLYSVSVFSHLTRGGCIDFVEFADLLQRSLHRILGRNSGRLQRSRGGEGDHRAGCVWATHLELTRWQTRHSGR